MKRSILGIFCLLLPLVAIAQEKDIKDLEASSSRPGFFHELKDTETLCMAICPNNLNSVFGLKVICGNFDGDSYQKSCSNISSDEPVEYCNCFKGECARFKVSCLKSGSICAVDLIATELQPSSCKCNGNSCEPPPGNFADAVCFMREVSATKVCEIERTVEFAAGPTYQISCEDGAATCESKGVQIRNDKIDPNLSKPKPSEPK